MSSLIDADDLIIKILTHDLKGDDKEVYKIILDAPTVKAIPIEWIKNIINTNTYLWEQNKERMFVDQGVVKVVNYSMTAQILSELIDRWEKENETN